MDPIAKLQAADPFFHDVTKDNFFDYYSLIKPELLKARALRLPNHELDAVTPFLAGHHGALMLQHFVPTHDDRTKYLLICDYLMDQCIITRHPSIHQVVIFDMVMDASAFRLAELAGCHVLEMCVNATVLGEKERCLAASGLPVLSSKRSTVQVDFRTEEWQQALEAQGFDPTKPTCWITASYLTYMTPKEGAEFVTKLAALSAHNSQIYADMFVGQPAELTADGESTKTPAFADINGDDTAVFDGLQNWTKESLASHDSNGDYAGTMWDADKLGQWAVPKTEKTYLGPWFALRYSKNE